MANLIDVLKEQSSFGFTGKVNVLSRENGQFLGVIYQQDGMIVGAQIKELKGKKALFNMIFADVDSAEDYRFILKSSIPKTSHSKSPLRN